MQIGKMTAYKFDVICRTAYVTCWYHFEILTKLINIKLNFNIFIPHNKYIIQSWKFKHGYVVVLSWFNQVQVSQPKVWLYFSLKYHIFDACTFSSVSFAVIQSLIDLVHCPEPEHPLRADVAEEFSKNNAKFMKNAEDFTKKNAEKRPAD